MSSVHRSFFGSARDLFRWLFGNGDSVTGFGWSSRWKNGSYESLSILVQLPPTERREANVSIDETEESEACEQAEPGRSISPPNI